MPTPPATVSAPVMELVEESVLLILRAPPNVDLPDVAMPPCTTKAPVVVLVEVAVRPLRITAPFLTMKSACAIQFPFPLDGYVLYLIFMRKRKRATKLPLCIMLQSPFVTLEYSYLPDYSSE